MNIFIRQNGERKLNCVKLYFGVVGGPPISQNGSAKLSISSKNPKQKRLAGQDPKPVREQDSQLLETVN